MTTKSKPVSTQNAGERLAAARKAKRDAENAEMAGLRAENARLKAAQAPSVLTSTGAVPITFIPVPDEAKRKELPNESRDVAWKDDLAWIDSSVHAVGIVAKKMTLTLRPYNTRVFPPIEQVMVHAKSTGAWPGNPFNLRSNDPDHEVRANREKHNAAMYAEWGHFVVTRELAKDVYGDPRVPVPTEAVVDAREFKGWDPDVQRGLGTYRPLGTPDPLRECVRNLLQRLANTYIDAARHGAQIREHPQIALNPNPYRPNLGNISQRLPRVEAEGATK